MLTTLKRLVGDGQERRLKKYRKMVSQINDLEQTMEKLTDQELAEKTLQFKEQLQNGKTIHDIKIEAFAVVREASKRVLGLRHFDVQLIGGLVLVDGDIAEMSTGEGKTLVASLPSYLRALEGKGVHVITVNDYLAKRDKELIGQVHEFLGLKVGLNIPMMDTQAKQEAYKADITYGVGNEFGFDYLRDNMVYSVNERVQRPFHFAIIDEIDSVLIDEAKTPLIIAGKMQVSPNLYYICAKLVKTFKEDEDYTYDRLIKTTNLTDKGISKVERAFGIDNLYELEHQTLYHFVLQALRAKVMFRKDVDYIVQDGELKLVDLFTGRIMEGRSYSEGLHQALEAKEGLKITEENKTQATITIQNYFRMYPNLCGMTGTAKTEEKEFQAVYNMNVIQVPTNKPRIRIDQEDYVYTTTEEKYTAVAKEVKERHAKGQPVLIGTSSIIQSETMATYLDKVNVPYELLNAKSVEKEVELISLAGQKGQVTIATNMAGRGTDIMLGEGVAELGGLYVIGTERHESRRIDNQLKGRSGRQGDPGETRFFISIEDEMLQRFGKEDIEKYKEKVQADETGRILNDDILDFVTQIQKRCEDSNFSAREYTLKLDDIINEQRNVIYTLRNRVLNEENIIIILKPMIASSIKNFIDHYCPQELLPEEWNLKQLASRLSMIIPKTTITFDKEIYDRKDITKTMHDYVTPYLEKLDSLVDNEELQLTARQLLLRNIDIQWLNHIEEMSRLKEGIGLRGYSQEDPMRIYNREGFELFQSMYQSLQNDASIQFGRYVRKFLEEDEN